MIRIAICDDEKKILDEMSGYIQSYAEKKSITDLEVFPFESAKTLIGAIEDGKSFDVFILDVYIGDEMGTALARDIRKMGIESPIIFSTTSIAPISVFALSKGKTSRSVMLFFSA